MYVFCTGLILIGCALFNPGEGVHEEAQDRIALEKMQDCLNTSFERREVMHNQNFQVIRDNKTACEA